MARKPRRAITGYPHHVVNRGNDRRRLFFTEADYESFLHLMVVGKSRYPVRVYGVAIMPNHFHAMVVPEADAALSGYLQWVSGSYASHLRARTPVVTVTCFSGVSGVTPSWNIVTFSQSSATSKPTHAQACW